MISTILRSFPTFQGKQRLARLLLNRYIADGYDLTISGKYGCLYNVPNIKETIGFEIFINGVYEEETIHFINSKLFRGKYLLDIGANIGAICIPLSKLRNDIKIICIEAAPWIYEYLIRNIEQNQVSNIVTINKAIAAEADHEVEFFSPKEKFGKGSLAPVFTESSVKVRTTTLDQLTENLEFKNIGLVKIDVEGFESQAFRGGGNLLSGPNAPDILFEFVDWAEAAAGMVPGEAQSVLMSYGYRIYVFQNRTLSQTLASPVNKGACMLYATKRAL